jgi:nitrogen fixation protein NifU and related proteins
MDLYAENILDHYRHPHNKGRISQKNRSANASNPLCGDKISMDILVDGDGIIGKVKFSGDGCAISQASASMLTDLITGMPEKKAKNLKSENIYKLLGLRPTPARIKCALLALDVMRKALNSKHAKKI